MSLAEKNHLSGFKLHILVVMRVSWGMFKYGAKPCEKSGILSFVKKLLV